MKAPPTRAKVYAVLAIVAVSTPLALVIETGLRQVMFPPEFPEVRMWLRPTITPWMWLAAPLALVVTPLGYRLQAWLVRRALAKLPPERRTEHERREQELDALLLSTSVPQFPALLATFGFMFGSELLPVVVAMAAATAGVIAVGVLVARRIPRGD
ncbi:MAG: hypothetical protein IAG13_25065 [Deltaproteobacteria bacterium]|nr:hypothetical protein [Nannocystaceae bacterium]